MAEDRWHVSDGADGSMSSAQLHHHVRLHPCEVEHSYECGLGVLRSYLLSYVACHLLWLDQQELHVAIHLLPRGAGHSSFTVVLF